MKLEVLFAPAEFEALKNRDLSESVCVVFDVLRATSSMITALVNGASVIYPVATIDEALTLRRQNPQLLLAGERDGLRIPAEMTGGIEFDFGNSPREFVADRVQSNAIAMTTTNGTRALRSCLGAKSVLVGSFLNMSETAAWILQTKPADLLVICSGTFEQAAYEDVLAAGALCDLVWAGYHDGALADSARIACDVFQAAQPDLAKVIANSRNGSRLLQRPELAADVPFCLQRDAFRLVAEQDHSGHVRRIVAPCNTRNNTTKQMR